MGALRQPPELLTLAEVASRLKMSIKSIRRLIDGGDLPRHFIKSRVRVSSDDLADYLVKCRR
jgi:excisionase family DNA binding protein